MNAPTPEQRANDRAFIAALNAADENLDRVRDARGTLETAIFWQRMWSDTDTCDWTDPDTYAAITILRRALVDVVREDTRP